MNEFVSIFELMQSRKDKINSKDITERLLFSLTHQSVYSKIIFLIASDWCSPVIVTNVCLHLILKNEQYKFYSLSLKVNWVYSLQYLFYHFL